MHRHAARRSGKIVARASGKRRAQGAGQARLLSSSFSRQNGSPEARDRRTMTDEWGKTPRDLHNHLSQYCIGQSLAKKILSVAVFNHYSRITPLLHPPPTSSSTYPHEVPGRPPSSSAYPSSSSSHDPSDEHASPSSGPSSSSTPASLILNPFPAKRRGRPPKLDVEGQGRSIPDPTAVDSQKDLDPTLMHEPPGKGEGADVGGWEGIGRNFYSRAPLPSPPSLLSRVRGALSTVSISGIEASSSSRNPTSDPAAVDLSADRNRSVKSKSEPSEDLKDVTIEKSNVLLLGPTGSGKSLLAKTLARILDVPFASSDATAFTQAGYVGEDVESCVLRLLKAADYDVTRAEVGIIHIDECDKLARRGGGGGDGGSWGGRDVAGEGVQQALLKLLEGTTLTLQAKPPPQAATPSPTITTGPSGYTSSYDHPDPTQRGFGGPSAADFGPKRGVREGLPLHGGGGGGGGGSGAKGEMFTVDTSNILFILSGSFVGLEKLIQRRIGKGSMGFNAILPILQKTSEYEDEVSSEDAKPEENRKSRLEGLTTGDLIEYGFIPEFVGRLPVLAPLHPLTIHDLNRVLTEPRNALIKQYRKIFSQHGCELRFSDSALSAIARMAARRGGSARHLRGSLEEVLLDSMYEVPGSSVRFVAITAEVVRKQAPASYFSRGQREAFYQTLQDDDRPSSPPPTFGFEEESEQEEERLSATG